MSPTRPPAPGAAWWRRGHPASPLLRLATAGMLGAMVSLAGAALASPAPSAAGPRIVAGSDGIDLEWRVEQPVVRLDSDGLSQVALPGYLLLKQPGSPRLPYASLLIAVPPGAFPTLEILAQEGAWQPLPGPLAVAPEPVGAQRTPDGQPAGLGYAPAPAVSAGPASHLAWEEAGSVRGVRLARLKFYPAIVDGGGLHALSHLRVLVRFGAVPAQITSASSAVLDQVRAAVINPDQVWAAAAPAFAAPAGLSQPAAVIEVSRPGLTAVTRDDLAAAGFPVDSTSPQRLQFTHDGQPVAAEWEGDGDEQFEAGERILFYSAPRFSRWTGTDAYVLSVATTPAARMSTRPAVPAAQPSAAAWVDKLAEANQLYMPHCYCGSFAPGRDGTPWVWDDLRLPDRAARSYTFTLASVDAAQPARLTTWLVGYTDVPSRAPDHRVRFSLNGMMLGQWEWNGRQTLTATLDIPAGLLLAGSNTLSLTLPGWDTFVVEGMWLDAFAVRHALGAAAAGPAVEFSGAAVPGSYAVSLSSSDGLRAYDITQPDQPVALTGIPVLNGVASLADPMAGGGRRYFVTTAVDIQAPAAVRPARPLSGVAGANYLVITHPDFQPALAPLLALRQSQGLTTAVESVLAVYDQFGGGRSDPEAIRDFLRYVSAAWSPVPDYVLLVGDGTLDPRQYRAGAPPTFIPPYLAVVDPGMGETVADDLYADLDPADGILPDFLLGRLPVNTLAEAQTVVAKIVSYETTPRPGDWNNLVAMAADAPDPAAADFALEAEALAQLIAPPFSVERHYLTPPAAETITSTREGVLRRWADGAGLYAFFGHSTPRQWTGERLFHMDDVSQLGNAGALPVVLELTCLTGSFHDPSANTLDETLVRQPGGGAVAAWGASGLGVATGHSELAEGFLRTIYQDRQPVLGAAVLQGKLQLSGAGHSLDLLATFNLLGDPALRVRLQNSPWPFSLFAPVIRR